VKSKTKSEIKGVSSKNISSPGLVEHACNPSAQETDARRFRVLSIEKRPYLKRKEEKVMKVEVCYQ
jgi:hypothetical protein